MQDVKISGSKFKKKQARSWDDNAYVLILPLWCWGYHTYVNLGWPGLCDAGVTVPVQRRQGCSPGSPHRWSSSHLPAVGLLGKWSSLLGEETLLFSFELFNQNRSQPTQITLNLLFLILLVIIIKLFVCIYMSLNTGICVSCQRGQLVGVNPLLLLWVSRMELGSSGFCSKHFYWLSHLTCSHRTLMAELLLMSLGALSFGISVGGLGRPRQD